MTGITKNNPMNLSKKKFSTASLTMQHLLALAVQGIYIWMLRKKSWVLIALLLSPKRIYTQLRHNERTRTTRSHQYRTNIADCLTSFNIHHARLGRRRSNSVDCNYLWSSGSWCCFRAVQPMELAVFMLQSPWNVLCLPSRSGIPGIQFDWYNHIPSISGQITTKHWFFTPALLE